MFLSEFYETLIKFLFDLPGVKTHVTFYEYSKNVNRVQTIAK